MNKNEYYQEYYKEYYKKNKVQILERVKNNYRNKRIKNIKPINNTPEIPQIIKKVVDRIIVKF